MKLFIILFLFSFNFFVIAGCDPVVSAIKFVNTDPAFIRWIGAKAVVSNIQYSNIQDINLQKSSVLIIFDYSNEYTSGKLTNMIIIDKDLCTGQLEWSAELHQL